MKSSGIYSGGMPDHTTAAQPEPAATGNAYMPNSFQMDALNQKQGLGVIHAGMAYQAAESMGNFINQAGSTAAQIMSDWFNMQVQKDAWAVKNNEIEKMGKMIDARKELGIASLETQEALSKDNKEGSIELAKIQSQLAQAIESIRSKERIQLDENRYILGNAQERFAVV